MDSRPRYLFHDTITSQGIPINVNFKGVVYKRADETDVVRWELRRFVKPLYSDRANFDLSDILKKEALDWASDLAEIGLTWSSEFFPSELSAKRRKVDVTTTDNDQEHMCSTRSILALLVTWTDKRLCKHRARAQAMLDVICCCGVVDLEAEGSAPLTILDSPPQACLDQCTINTDEDGLCDCMRAFFDRNRCDGSLSDGGRAARLLGALYPFDEECGALQAWLAMSLQNLATILDQHIDSYSESDPLKLPCKRVLLALNGGKTSRADYHYKQAVSLEVRNRKLAVTTAAYCKANACASASVALGWDEETTAAMQAAALLSCPVVGPVWLPSDCVRVGRPAEETLIMGCWDYRSDRGFPLPPVVFFLSGAPTEVNTRNLQQSRFSENTKISI